MKTLESFTAAGKNNYTVLRLAFACAVLFGHAFPITGNGFDPISKGLMPYTWVGGLAVSGFFVISGFLVTASFVARGAIYYSLSRCLRLYPAVIVYSVIAILLIGPLGRSVSLSEYFAANPWDNLWNATLWTWTGNLPYVFASNPFPGSTNGAAWTLPVELRCYLLILALGFFGLFEKQFRANLVLIVLLFAINQPGFIQVLGYEERYANPIAFFLLGSLAWVNQSFIPLSYAAAVLAAVLSFLTTWSGGHFQIHQICVAYVIFVLAYRTPHLHLDRWGDISYGIYIYAWPVQQLIWYEGQSGWVNSILASSIVIPVAYLSWRFVEAPALSLRPLLRLKTSGVNGRVGNYSNIPSVKSEIVQSPVSESVPVPSPRKDAM